jgi:multidrug efflux pump
VSFNLSDWALRHRPFIGFAVVLLFLGGLFALRVIHQREDPDFAFRVMVVRTGYPGATAREVTEQLTDVLEKKLQDMPSLDYLKSYSKPGESVVFVYPRQDLPVQELPEFWYQIRKKIGDIRAFLPPGIAGPFFNDEFGDTYSLLYAISGDGLRYSELKDVADDVRQQLLRVPDVEKAELIGVQDERVYIDFSEAKLATLKLDARQVAAALQAQNSVVAAGIVDTDQVNVPLRVDGSFHSIAEVAELRVRVNGSTFRVADFANVRRGYVDPPDMKMRFNGREVVGLGIVPNKRADVIKVGEALDRSVGAIQAALPVGIDIERVANQPRVIRSAIGEFARTFVEALAVVLFVSFASLGLRAGSVVALTVPLVLAGSFLVMLVSGIELHRISLGALVLSLGILVDDAMIAVEMMSRKLQEGMERIPAASFAYTATAFPMLTGTLISIAGFLPVGLARSQAGEYTGSIFWIMAISLLLSWAGAVVFTPYLGYFLLPDRPPGGHDVFSTPFYDRLRRLIDWCVANRKTVIAGTLALFLLGIGAFSKVSRQFFPQSNRPELLVDLWLPEGSSFAQTQVAAKRMEEILAKDPGVEHYATYVGAGSPRFFLLLVQQLTTVNLSEIVVMTKDNKTREAVKERLEAQLARDFPGVQGRVQRLAVGPPLEYPAEFRVRGPDPAKVREIADEVAAVMRRHPGAVDVSDDWRERIPVARLLVDQDRARALGVSTESIGAALQAHVSGITVGQYREGNKLIPTVWRADPAERGRIDVIDRVYVRNAGGEPLPLSQLVRVQTQFEEGVIWRRDRFPTVTVQCDTAPGVQGPDLMNEVDHALEPLRAALPAGYFIEPGATLEASGIAQGSIFVWLPLVAAVTLFLLMAQLHNFRRTMLVVVTAPLGVIGAAIALLVSRAPFGFVALLGLIALAGLIMRNTVILVDQIDQDERSGLDTWTAIVESTVRRFRPIMLTASAAVLAMVPLSRSDFFGPQAITLLGGLLVATGLTIVFVPALYAAWFGVQRAGPPGGERASPADGSSSLTGRIRTFASAFAKSLPWNPRAS